MTRIIIEIDGDNVKVITDKEETKVIEPKESKVGDSVSQYARFFDESCTAWESDSEYNLMYLQTQERYANEMLVTRKHVFLNEVYDMLGIPKSKAGQIVGWTYDKENPNGDNFISFGLHEDRNRAFINGYSNTAILDFNVDGDIMDLI